MTDRTLPSTVDILPGTDVVGAWDRFEVFEALHHEMTICNPMSTDNLDEVLDLLAPVDGEIMLDIACGHGELLLRAARRAAIAGCGVDSSPWVIRRAHEAGTAPGLQGSLSWRLGDAHALDPGERFNIVTCLGASWIWHGFGGTVRAMVKRTGDEGRIAIGDLRLRAGADAAHIADTYGKVLTLEDQRGVLEDAGVEIVGQLNAGDAGWDGYQDRIRASAESWAVMHPGATAQCYLAEQAQWRSEHVRDRAFLDWTVWVGTVRRPPRLTS